MGSVVISIDAELGWGFHDHDAPPVSRLEAGRPGWRTLLDILNRCEVPATWGVVGHLFLDDCDGVHADHPSIDGWFDRDGGGWRTRPDLRFGPDLIADVVESPVDHEIACHTFSHVRFGDDATTEGIARSELERAIEAGRAAGIEYDSFIFPRNDVGHRDLLAEFDFACYRGSGLEASRRLRRVARKALAAVDPGRVDLVDPTVDEHGLVDVPPSLFLFGFEGWPRRVAERLWADPIVRQAEDGVGRAAEGDGVFHLWLHPNNLRTERDVERVRAVVEYVARRRDRGDVTVETMADVAARVD